MRRLRTEAGMSLERLADVLNYGKSSLARYETAESMIPPELPEKLDAAFGAGQLFVKLYGLARKELHPDQFRRRMELESQSRLIEEYSGQLVPGLVQTEEYMRALFWMFNPVATPEEVEDLVTARLSRQAGLTTAPQPSLSLILDEAVIRRPYGKPGVMRAQLAYLADLALSPTCLLQVVPFSHGGHALTGGSLALFTLKKGERFAWEEGISTGTLTEVTANVDFWQRAYDRLRACALSPSDSASLIQSVMKELPA